MVAPEGENDRQEQPVCSRPYGPARRELSRRQLLAKAGAVGGVGVLLPALAVGLPAAQVEASSPTSGSDPRHELYLGSMKLGSVPIAVFTALVRESHGLDVEYQFIGNGPTDQQTTSTRGILNTTVSLVRPLGDMNMWNLLWQIRQGNFQKVVENMDLLSRDSNGNTLSKIRLFNAWVSAINVYGDAENGWFEGVNLTCDDFRRAS